MADISEDENVLVEARSGVRSLKIGALALRRSIDIQGTVYCFKDLFELRHRGDRWATKGLANNPTRRGDSGAWVFRETPLENDWLGMVTAGDGPSSYAQFSELVMDWANSKIAARP